MPCVERKAWSVPACVCVRLSGMAILSSGSAQRGSAERDEQRKTDAENGEWKHEVAIGQNRSGLVRESHRELQCNWRNDKEAAQAVSRTPTLSNTRNPLQIRRERDVGKACFGE